MTPLWQEIMSHFPIYNHSTTSGLKPKLALFSGHDTTLIPLLASLGSRVWDGTEWIPYASMMVIEIHDIILVNSSLSVNDLALVKKKFPSSKAFRIMYNGHVLTDKVDGCTLESDLCDVSYLMNQLLSFLQVDSPWSCDLTEAERASSSTLLDEFTERISLLTAIFKTPGGKAFLLLTIAASAFLSSLLTFVVMTRRCPFWCRSRCCRRGEQAMSDSNLRDYESITFSSGYTKNDNIVKPGGWKDPRKKSDFRYVEVPSWFLSESDAEPRGIT